MPTIKDARERRSEHEHLLREAVNNWNPERPRRWLNKYGCWNADGQSVLAQQYRLLRSMAQKKLARPGSRRDSGLASHTLHYYDHR